MELQDLYNYNSLETGTFDQGQVQDLIKAMSAGSTTGRTLDGVETAGAALKTESLDAALKILTSTDKHIVFYKMLPKEKAYNTVEEYNQLVDYGLNIGIFNNEGETPQATDSIYRRQSVLVKYMGVMGEVTHPFTLVRLGSGITNALAQETQNKTQFLLRAINKSLATADSTMIDNEFDGIFKQHYAGISTTLDGYAANSVVLDARGGWLTDALVEEASHAVVNDNFGMVSTIMGAPVIFNNYVKAFHESKRINVNNPLEATTGATMGQNVNKIATQFGMINIENDIFFDHKTGKAYNEAATSAKAPAKPTKDGATPLAAATDTLNKFGTAFDGSYWYAVTAKNRYGESSMELLSTSALAVASTESADLIFTQTDNSYPAESFVIYRTELSAVAYTTAKFYPIMTVSVAQKAAGYDGSGVPGTIRDRNRTIPNTYTAMVTDVSTDIMAYKQLAPMMRMDLAITSPSYRFMVLNYGTPVLYQPKKVALIKNLGTYVATP